MMKCPNCGNENQPDAVFCDQCGTRLDSQAVATPAAEPVTTAPAAPAPTPASAPAPTPVAMPGVCPECGAANTPGEMFCGECGAPLDAPAPEPTAVAAQPEPVTIIVPSEPESTVAPAAAPACPKCGAPAEPGDAFCAKCGASLAAAPAPAPAPAAEPVAAAATIVPEPAPAAAPAPAPLTECPSCGAEVDPGDAFCDFCGAALVGAAAAARTATVAPATAAAVVAPQPAPMPATRPSVGGPYLTVVASGARIELPDSGEALVGREDPLSNTFPDVDLTPHGGEQGGVSRRHFKITLGEGQYAVQDLNSTNATWVNHSRLQPGLPIALHDGDEIRAGLVKMVFHAG